MGSNSGVKKDQKEVQDDQPNDKDGQDDQLCDLLGQEYRYPPQPRRIRGTLERIYQQMCDEMNLTIYIGGKI